MGRTVSVFTIDRRDCDYDGLEQDCSAGSVPEGTCEEQEITPV